MERADNTREKEDKNIIRELVPDDSGDRR